jgi:hypothetical protein
VRVEVKLGLLSPDALHVLMLYMALPEQSGAWQLVLQLVNCSTIVNCSTTLYCVCIFVYLLRLTRSMC